MGTDAPSLNSTATGVTLIQRASMDKTDLMAMNYGEQFVTDIYNKLIFLFQRNMDIPRAVVVDGQEILVTKEMIQGNYKARLDIGVDVDFDDRAVAKAQLLLGVAMQMSEKFGWGYEPVYEHLKNLYVSAGVKDIDKYVPNPEQVMAWQMQQLQQQLALAQSAGPGPGGGKPKALPAGAPIPPGAPPDPRNEFGGGMSPAKANAIMGEQG